MNRRTLKVLCENSKIATLMLVLSDSRPGFIFKRNNQRNYNEDIEEDKNVGEG